MPGLLRRVQELLGRQVYELSYGWGPRLMSALRKRWIRFLHRHADVRFGPGVHIAPGFSLYIPAGGTFHVGEKTEFRRGFRAEVIDGGSVVIGARCVFSYYSLIQCSSSVEIGDGCGFGQSCAIFDGNHLFKDLSKPFMNQGFVLRPIRIGSECGILTKTTVINDIGDRAQVGANSVVVSPIPAFSVAVGSPARIIDYFGPEDQRPPELSERGGLGYSDASPASAPS
ncbi:MAG TPA: acyltransferase [Solirubrobacteraceae bacterium]|nr:acyltransferase [Solirubrobacteraceae bacterium]